MENCKTNLIRETHEVKACNANCNKKPNVKKTQINLFLSTPNTSHLLNSAPTLSCNPITIKGLIVSSEAKHRQIIE